MLLPCAQAFLRLALFCFCRKDIFFPIKQLSTGQAMARPVDFFCPALSPVVEIFRNSCVFSVLNWPRENKQKIFLRYIDVPFCQQHLL